MISLIWLAIVLTPLVLYLWMVYSKLARAGISHLPIVPLLGDMTSVVLRKEHLLNVMMRAYESFPKDRIVGRYEFLYPTILIRDIDLLKKITVKDFDYFVDKRTLFDESADPIFSRFLTMLKGDEWKDMRSVLSPAFTSSKIRLMVPSMLEISNQMIKAIRKKIDLSKDDCVDVETRDLGSRYANDVMASCAFGLKVDSQHEDSEFFIMCKKVTNFNFIRQLKVFGYMSLPTLVKKLRLNVFPQSTTDYFKYVFLNSMRQRGELGTVRSDIIQLLHEAKKAQSSNQSINQAKPSQRVDAECITNDQSALGKKQILREWSDTDLVAQAVLLLFAGFDTVSTAVAFLLHELALHSDVQERLTHEIEETHEKNSRKFDYGSVQRMPYLNMVISESLRLWPPASFLDRLCVKDYNMGKPNSKCSKDYILRKGESVIIPVWAFHHDPEYFPDPYKFDPERFSEQNKHNIKPFTYMPFGLGPRNCIGSRFALCEMKLLIYQLLLHIEVTASAKTQIPAQLTSDGFTMRIQGGHWVQMKLRKKVEKQILI